MRSTRIQGCTAAAAALAALALAGPAQALLFHLPEGFSSGVYGKVRVWVEPDDGPIQVVADTRLDPDPVTYGQFVLSVANEAGLNSAATVVGRVGRGYAQLDAIAIARQQGSEAHSYAEVHAGAAFGDVLTVSAPGREGTTGTLRVGVRLHGGLSAGSNGWDFDIKAVAYGGAVVFGVTEARYVLAPGDASLNPAELFDERDLWRDVDFVFGEPFSFAFVLEIEGWAEAEVSTPGRTAVSSFVGDFGHTLAWAGILELRDAHGQLVTDFELTSLSGTDYRNAIVPVPEPGSSLPALASLAALAWRRR